MKPPVVTGYPLLKNYTESPLVQVVQRVLNKVRDDWGLAPYYFPPDLIRKIGATTFAKLQAEDFLLEDDGKFGKLTAGRVMIYQHGKGIGVDGKVGASETWPELEKSFERLRKQAIRAAATRMPNLPNATQTIRGGNDCGFFAAFAVAETAKGSAALLNFDRDDVLAARDAHYPFIDDKWAGKERTSGLGMDRSEAAGYLAKLGAPGYRKIKLNGSDKASVKAFEAFLFARSNSGRSPFLIVLPDFLAQGYGHWIGILDVQVVGGVTLWLVFDSSPLIPNESRAEGWPAGAATVWLDAESIRKWVVDKGGDEAIAKQ